MNFDDLLSMFKFFEDEEIDSVIIDRTENKRTYTIKRDKIIDRISLIIETQDMNNQEQKQV